LSSQLLQVSAWYAEQLLTPHAAVHVPVPARPQTVQVPVPPAVQSGPHGPQTKTLSPASSQICVPVHPLGMVQERVVPCWNWMNEHASARAPRGIVDATRAPTSQDVRTNLRQWNI
jgi:hypothetical protein